MKLPTKKDIKILTSKYEDQLTKNAERGMNVDMDTALYDFKEGVKATIKLIKQFNLDEHLEIHKSIH